MTKITVYNIPHLIIDISNGICIFNEVHIIPFLLLLLLLFPVCFGNITGSKRIILRVESRRQYKHMYEIIIRACNRTRLLTFLRNKNSRYTLFHLNVLFTVGAAVVLLHTPPINVSLVSIYSAIHSFFSTYVLPVFFAHILIYENDNRLG